MTVSEDKVMAALESRLEASSLQHSRSVAGMALLLATVYGVDERKAQIAGLLHDWDRDLGGEELLETAARLGLEVTDADRALPYLLHARTAACGVAEQFPGLDDDVYLAIERHTTGASMMSDLDKVVYIADMIEPLRDFEGVDALREAAGNVSLDDFFSLCYATSMRHLVESRRFIHPLTIDVWNAHVAKDAL